ncbi:MAG: FliM/FliN family flagellar motor switch protein [Thermoguttaceae bacterium]
MTAITNGAGEAASAFSRTFDKDVTFSAGSGGTLNLDKLKSDFSGSGVAMTLQTGDKAILILVPASTGLIPDWCKNPDATGKSKLSTLAQELGMNVAPDDFFPEECRAQMVPNLAEAAENGKIGENPGFAELIINASGTKTTAIILWPIEDREEVFKVPFPEEPTAGAANPASAASPASAPASPAASAQPKPSGAAPFGAAFSSPPPFGNAFGTAPATSDYNATDFEELENRRLSTDELPGFSKSVLKVKIPVAAVLARGRRTIKTILELGIGSIIQFDKSCDELLELEIDRTIVAHGEAVKVGDKFGIRLSTVLLPKERFRQVEVRHEGEYKRKTTRGAQIIGRAPIKSLETKG